MKNWIEKYFKETWEEVETDIDFSKYTPSHTANSLHIFEERFEIDGETYRLLYAIGDETNTPLIEKLRK